MTQRSGGRGTADPMRATTTATLRKSLRINAGEQRWQSD